MYSQEITRAHRTAIVIAIDQSSSMGGRIELNGVSVAKAEVVSIVTGRLIDELILRCHRDGGYRNYYDIAILGYSEDRVYSLLDNHIAFHPITELAEREVRRVEYNLPYKTLHCGFIPFKEEISLWVEPYAYGNTPMYKMLSSVTNLVEGWCAKRENSESFPPIVFNISDGEASDGDYDLLRSAALRLQRSGTRDGNTLFVNIHISSTALQEPLIFPTMAEVPLSTRYAHLLMDMSSVMPEQFNHYIKECRSHFAQPPYIAMSYNSSISELIAMLNIGTRSSTAVKD